MQLELTIEKFRDEPLSRKESHIFDKNGGGIGRNDSNCLVLEDPSLFTSGFHARIDYESSMFYLTDLSTNGTYFNSRNQVIGRDNRVELKEGDMLFIGEYQLVARFLKQDKVASAAVHVKNDDSMGQWFDVGQKSSESLENSGPFDDPVLAQKSIAPPAPPQNPENEFFKVPVASPEDGELIPDDWDRYFSGIVEIPESIKMDSKQKQPPVIPKSRKKSRQSSSASIPKKKVSRAKKGVKRTHATENDVLKQLFAGMGLKYEDMVEPGEFAFEVGRSLRVVSQGFMEILAVRAKLKNEFRVEQTMMVASANNPLKFSPSLEEAMHRMFVDKGDGFLASNAAFRGAIEDVNAHQMALLSGMQAGLSAVIKHFKPENLENEINRYSPLASKIPGVREAKLWSCFADLYERIAEEAESDFHHLFSSEFAQAYEQQIGLVRNAKKKS